MKRQEIIEKRTANRKVFQNEDHSITTEIYLDSVHYEEKDGIWKEMDDTLEEENGQKEKFYTNRKGKLKIRFRNKTKEQKTIVMTKGENSISWGLEGCRTATGEKISKTTLIYPGVGEELDLCLYVKGEKVKENLLLKKRAEKAPEFSFLYQMKKLTPVLLEKGVSFVNEQGEEIFFVSAPYMQDAAGAKSEQIQISLEDTGKKTCRIVFTPDADWLQAQERQYPVCIDPVTTTSKKAADISDAHVSSLYEEDNFKDSIFLKTKGGDEVDRTFLKFDLPEIQSGDMVIRARLVMVSLAEDGKERIFQAHRVLNTWDQATINWYNKPPYDETVEDLCIYTGDKQKYVTLDITRLVKDWYQNGKNYGLMLKDVYELSGYTEFLSADCHDGYQDMRPRIEISYVNYSGIEDYWTYHTQEIGRAGTVYVNDYNGNVILSHPTLKTSGSRMPMQLFHVYNSNHRQVNMGYGYGYRLNYHQTLDEVTIAGTKYYRHTDGDGTIHYFLYDEKKKEWKEESGLELTLTVNGTGAEPYVIRDKEDNRMIFGNSHRLTGLEDKNGNTLTISYQDERITKITDGAGRMTIFTYLTDAAGRKTNLSKITTPAGKEIVFRYQEDKLVSIKDPDAEEVSYSYTSRGLLAEAKNIDGYKVKYTYYSTMPYRVRTITEYGGETEGNRLTLTYGYNSTKFTDRKNRNLIYRFDHKGNLLHIHDGFGHAASSKYSQDKNYWNRLECETNLQSNVIQLLKDPIIQEKKCGWISKIAPAGAGTVSINEDAANCKVGNRSLRVDGATLTGYVYWGQTVSVKKGETYTASMYVKASITEAAEDGGARLRILYKDKNGKNKIRESEILAQSTEDFVLLSVTFTLPLDAGEDTVKLMMMMFHDTGWMCGDMAQLEKGTTVSRCNLINNGDFHLGQASGFSRTGKVIDGVVTAGTPLNFPVQSALTVTASSADVYIKPDTSETKIATLTKGTHLAGELQMTSEGSSWYRVRLADGSQGYLSTSKAVPYLAGTNGLNAGAVGVTGSILRASASDTGTPVLEYIPKGTSIVLVNNKLDDKKNRWYYVGMQIDKTRYFGYLKTDDIIRLCHNRAYGKMKAADKLYQIMSTSGTAVASLEAGETVYLRGVVTRSSGEKWYAVLQGQNFVFLQEKNLELKTELAIDRIKTVSVTEGVGELNEYIYRFFGDPRMDKKLTRTLEISGKKGDTYMINAWGRGVSLPETENHKNRRFGVELIFLNGTGTKDVHYTNFSPDIMDWQFLSDVYVAKNDYTSIQVSYTYCRNANMAFFDGLSLFREEFGQTYTYDEDNHLVSVIDAQKKATKFEYNSNNDMTGIVDAKGNKFTYAYDGKHNVTKGTTAEGVVYRLSYDSAGNVVKSGAALPTDEKVGTWITRTMTNNQNHILRVTDAADHTVEYDWDHERDLLLHMTDGRGNRTAYGYDEADRLISVSRELTINGEKQTLTNTYGYTKDRLTDIGHHGFHYQFAHDAFGHMVSASVAGRQVIGYEYEGNNGSLSRLLYGNGSSIRYTYDAQDRAALTYYKETEEQAEQKLHQYVYDRQGNLVQVTDHMSGKIYQMYYDFLGRLMRVRDEQGNAYEYTYDVNNHMTGLFHSRKTGGVRTAYTYDKDGKELKSKCTSTFARSTKYDALGRVTAHTWSSVKPFETGYTYFNYGDNRYSLPKTIKNGNETLEYTYDANGNITSIQDTSGRSTFLYDEGNQLIRENNHALNQTLTYGYDLGGNLVEVKTYDFTEAETLPAEAIGTETGTYDPVWKDQLLNWNGITMTYDAIGNMLTRGNTTYTWTQGRKLAGVENGRSIQYFYDHTGARVKKIVDGVETEYHMAGDLLVSETTNNRTIWYRYDSNANLISMTIAGKIYGCVRNAQNDVTALIDHDGNVVVKYTYDSWGNVRKIEGSLADTIGVQNPFRYRGYYFDQETGMYYLKNRYYDPKLRRFICADSLKALKAGEDFGGKNLYVYCNGNPVAMLDDEGEFAISLIKAAVGAVVNVATTYIAAKVTGQEYGILDGVFAAASGAVNSITTFKETAMHLLSGLISGAYASYVVYKETEDMGAAAAAGIGNAVCTVATPQNLVDFTKIDVKPSIAVSVATDATFGFGNNLAAAAAVKAANQKKRWMPGRIIAYVQQYDPKTGITKLVPVYLKGYFY